MSTQTAPIPRPRSWSTRDTWGAIVCLTVAASGPAFSWQLSSFLHAKEAVLSIGLALLGISARHRLNLSRDLFLTFGPLWLLLAWSVVTHLLFGQAHVNAYVVSELVRMSTLLILGVFGLAVFRLPRWRSRLSDSLILSALIVATLALIQYSNLLPDLFPAFEYFDQPVYSVFGNQGLLGAYMALAIPLALTKYTNRARPGGIRYAIALVALLIVLIISQSRSAWLAAFIGTTCCVPYLRLKRSSLAKIAIVGVLAASVAVAILSRNGDGKIRNTLSENDVGATARVWYWDGTMRMIRDHALVGVGLGNFNYWSPYYLGEALHENANRRRFQNEAHAVHAHSDVLEILAESGVVGLLCVLWMCWRMRRCRGPEWGGVIALGVYSLANATYTMPAHSLAALMLMASMLSAQVPRRPGDCSGRKDSVFFSLALSTSCIALGLFTTVTTLIPSYRLELALNAKKNEQQAHELFEQAIAGPWPSYSAHEEYGLFLLDYERYEEARAPLQIAAKGIDTGRIHYLSAVAARETHDLKAAQKEFEGCVWRWPANVFAWSGLLEILDGKEREGRTQEALSWLKPEDHSLLFP